MRSTMSRNFSRGLLAAALTALIALPALAAGQGYLGVTTRATDADLRRSLDLTRDGLLVNQVEEDSPADRAGLKRGDVILSFNSRNVSDPADLRTLVRQTEPGRSIALAILRDGERRTLDVKLGEVPEGDGAYELPTPPTAPKAPKAPRAPRAYSWSDDDDEKGDGKTHRRVIINGKEIPEDEIDETLRDMKIKVFDDDSMEGLKHLKGLKGLEGLEGLKGLRAFDGQGGRMMFAPSPSRGRLGVRVDRLSDEMRDALGASGKDGVLVLEVMGDTPAQRAGLRAGDIIVRVGDDAVESPDELVQALRGHDGKVQVQIVRKGIAKSLEAELRDDAEDEDGPAVAPRVRIERRNREPGQGGSVYRWKTRDEAGDRSDLREELEQLKQELRELRQELRDRK